MPSFLNGRLSDFLRNMGHSMPILLCYSVLGIERHLHSMSRLAFNASNGI
jgi:hypothetical protein